MTDPGLLGRFGEAAAAEYLRGKGYRILGQNYRTRRGEIDLIASGGRYLVFAEVKLRKNDSFAQAREFVTPAKQRRLIAAAESWLQRHPTSLQPRFDVLEIYAPEGTDTAHPLFRHWENAFGAD